MSKTFTKIINLIFIAYFLMPAFSSIKLANKKAISGKKSISIENHSFNRTAIKKSLINALSSNSTKALNKTNMKTDMNLKMENDLFSAKILKDVQNKAEVALGPQIKNFANRMLKIANNTIFLEKSSDSNSSQKQSLLIKDVFVLPNGTQITPTSEEQKNLNQIRNDLKHATELKNVEKHVEKRFNDHVYNSQKKNNNNQNINNNNQNNNNNNQNNNNNNRDLVDEIRNRVNNDQNNNKLVNDIKNRISSNNQNNNNQNNNNSNKFINWIRNRNKNNNQNNNNQNNNQNNNNQNKFINWIRNRNNNNNQNNNNNNQNNNNNNNNQNNNNNNQNIIKNVIENKIRDKFNNNNNQNNNNNNNIKNNNNNNQNNNNNNNNQNNNNNNNQNSIKNLIENKIRDKFNNNNNNQNNNNNNNNNDNNNNNNNNNDRINEISNRINNKITEKRNDRKQKLQHLVNSAIVNRETRRDGEKTIDKGSLVNKIDKIATDEHLSKDHFVKKVNKHLTKRNVERVEIKDDIRKEKEVVLNESIEKIIQERTRRIFEKNAMIEDIIKDKNLNIIGAPILEIGIKQRGSRSMNEAESSLKREIASHLEKEIAQETLRKAKEAEIILNNQSSSILKRTGDELKRQVAMEVLNENINHQEVKDKAKVAELLEHVNSSSEVQKEMAVRVLKKAIEGLGEETNIENFRKIDPVKILDETNISDVFKYAVMKLKDMIENQKERTIAKEILEKAEKADMKEKKIALSVVERAIKDMTKSSNELKREIEGREILELEEDNNNLEGNFNRNKVINEIRNLKEEKKTENIIKHVEHKNKKDCSNKNSGSHNIAQKFINAIKIDDMKKMNDLKFDAKIVQHEAKNDKNKLKTRNLRRN